MSDVCFVFCCRNAAIFPVDDPSAAPLVGDATIVVVNDARHQLEANFLQRTVPYFFELTGGHPTVAAGGRYRWAKVGIHTTLPLHTVRTTNAWVWGRTYYLFVLPPVFCPHFLRRLACPPPPCGLFCLALCFGACAVFF